MKLGKRFVLSPENLETRSLLTATLLADFNQQPAFVSVEDQAATDTHAYFLTHDGDHKLDLWSTDGDKLQLIREAQNPLDPEQSRWSVDLNDGAAATRLYFTVPASSTDHDLYVSEGTTSTLLGAYPIVDMTPVGNSLLFVTREGRGSALWISEGTAETTRNLSDGDANLADSAADGDILYFQRNRYELWSTDGTPKGTQLYSKLDSLESRLRPEKLYFAGENFTTSHPVAQKRSYGPLKILRPWNFRTNCSRSGAPPVGNRTAPSKALSRC